MCEICHGYLRAIDEHDLPEEHQTDFLTEDVGTFYLCLLAEKEGYRQGVIQNIADKSVESDKGGKQPGNLI